MRKSKYFTPEEANKTLPLVRQIVEDILALGQKIRQKRKQTSDPSEPDDETEPMLEKLAEYFRELEKIGCSYRDWNFEIGLVDFPAVIDGEQVLLCWRSDEPKVAYYHGVHAGYAGRKPIPEKYLSHSQPK